MKTTNKILYRLAFLLVSIFFSIGTNSVPVRAAKLGIEDSTFYVADASDCSSVPSANSSVSSKSIYVIGDSITVGMNRPVIGEGKTLSEVLTAKGWQPTINAQGSRPLYYPNTPTQEVTGVTSAFNEFVKDKPVISSVGAVVIALGTNKTETDVAEFKQKSIEYIGLLREANPLLGNYIYWVNLYSRSGSLETRNQAINEIASETGIKVIDYRTVAVDETKYPFQDSQASQVHLSDVGYANKASFIADSLPAPPGGAPAVAGLTNGGGYNPISLTYPDFPNESEIIANLKAHITSVYPKSPFAQNLQYVDSIFSIAKQLDINPLLPIAIAQQENGYGQANSSATENNNYFGITQGAGYRHFDSVEESITYFLEKINRHVDTPDGNYLKVRTFYEYISVHQAGVLAYPGEYPPDARGLNATPQYLSGDPRMGGVLISWDPNANVNNPNPKYRGMYNPGIYFENSMNLINKITGLDLPTQPSKNGVVSVGGCASLSSPSTGDASQYIKDCGVNSGNAEIACTAINQLTGIAYSMELRARPTDPSPKFIDCSALVAMAIYRAFGQDLGGICSADFLTSQYFQVIDVKDILPGDMVGRGAACGGAGHIALVVSYDSASKKLITVEASSEKHPSGLRGIGGVHGYNVGLEVDGNGGYTWAVRYIGPKN